MSLRSLSTVEIADLMHRSTVVFDFPNFLQAGFTIHFIQNICAGKKIMTERRNLLDAPSFDLARFNVVLNLNFSSAMEVIRLSLAQRDSESPFFIGKWVSQEVT